MRTPAGLERPIHELRESGRTVGLKHLLAIVIALCLLHGGTAQAQVRMAVNFLSYTSGDVEYEDSTESDDFSGGAVGGTGMKIGYRFAEHYEAGLNVSVMSVGSEDNKHRDESIGAYGSYHFVGRESGEDSDLSWFVGAQFSGLTLVRSGTDIKGSYFGVFGGPEYKLTESASISTQGSFGKFSGKVESSSKLSGAMLGMGIALSVWLPVSVDKAPAGPSRRR